MKNRIFQGLRLLVCLILVCCFLVNSSPIKAKAGLVEGLISAPLPVEAKVVAGAILVCLGIMAASDPTAFNNAVDNFVNFLSETTSYVVDGMINVFGVVGADGLVRSYLPQDLLETGLCWAFESGTVSDAHVPGLSHTFTFMGSNYTVESLNGVPFTLGVFYDSYFKDLAVTAWAGSSCNVSVNGSAKTLSGSNGFYYANIIQKTGVSSFSSVTSSLPTYNYWHSGNVSKFPSMGLSSSPGLSLGNIQAPSSEVAFGDLDAYSAYAGGVVDIPGTADDDEVAVPLPHLPVGIPGLEYNDDVTTQTQDQAQTGVTDLEFEFAGDNVIGGDTVTDGAITGSGTITSGIKDFFDFAPEDLVLPASLTDLFPFCIPKDILDLVKVFRAEPEAPRFIFDVPFPYMDEPWHIDIDFAAWNPVALVLRRLELLLFVVGLAMATRNYYIRG